MKLFIFTLLSLLILCFCSENNLRTNINTQAVKCSISTISIPKGSNLPIVVFRLNTGLEDVNLTVVENEDLNKLKIKGNLVYEDKTNGESWFSENNYNDKKIESMRDAFSLCKTIHEENKGNKLYDDNESNRKNKKSILQYRIQSLPENIELVDNKAKTKVASNSVTKDNDNIAENTSFLQSKVSLTSGNKLKNSSNSQVKLETGIKFDSFIRLKEMFKFNDVHF